MKKLTKKKLALIVLAVVVVFAAWRVMDDPALLESLLGGGTTYTPPDAGSGTVSGDTAGTPNVTDPGEADDPTPPPANDPETVPPYSGQPYVVLNGGMPNFTEEEKASSEAFETYSPLDSLGRCGPAFACVGLELMPTESRGNISSIYPTGWENERYDFVDGQSLYNRCHLIAHQLTGENANDRNLITGTRYMNTEGMIIFENMVADYVKETGNHVLYRVTPIFEGDELLARGVQLEAWSLEDEGDGVCFNVYSYNVQPGIILDYATGYNAVDEAYFSQDGEKGTYVLNTGSKKFHLPDCSGAQDMKQSNRQDYTGLRIILIDQGFIPCTQCNP